jgi:hypothetical membrane protein
VTELLLLVAVSAALVFVFVVLIEGALRPGYDPTYHTGSELELGTRGWVQRVNFLLMGAGSLAFAVGVYRTLDSIVGAVLLAIFGLGLIVAGVSHRTLFGAIHPGPHPSPQPSRPGAPWSTQSLAGPSRS